MKFTFSLQAVLDVKHSRVEGLEIELGQLNRAHLEMEMLLHSLRVTLDDVLLELQKQREKDEFDLFIISRWQENVVYTEEQIKKTREELRALEMRIEEKRKAIIVAKQEEEILKILREKEYQRLLDSMEMVEKKEVDDMYNFRAYRMSHANNGVSGKN